MYLLSEFATMSVLDTLFIFFEYMYKMPLTMKSI